MSLFKKIKDWFNGGDDSNDVLILENALKTKNDATIDTVVKTNPVTVKPKPSTAQNPNQETAQSLERMTKIQIDELAAERFGIQLDRRKKKETMIEEFLEAQQTNK